MGFGYDKSLGKKLSGQSKPLSEGLEGERHVYCLKHKYGYASWFHQLKLGSEGICQAGHLKPH